MLLMGLGMNDYILMKLHAWSSKDQYFDHNTKYYVM